MANFNKLPMAAQLLSHENLRTVSGMLGLSKKLIYSPTGATVKVTSYPFLATDEENINVTIQVLDADDNVLFAHTVNNVPFKRNRKTTLRGNIFTAGTSSAGFQLETSWLTDADPINF